MSQFIVTVRPRTDHATPRSSAVAGSAVLGCIPGPSIALACVPSPSDAGAYAVDGPVALACRVGPPSASPART